VSLRSLLCVAILLGAALGLGCTSSEEALARHLERAQLYRESGQADKALIELKAALQLAPQRAETNLEIALLHEGNEKYEEALFYFEEALRLAPDDEGAALGVARLLRFQDTDRAEELVAKVLERNPGSARAHMLRSDVLLVRNDVAGALAAALTSAELEPDSARGALQVAMVRKAVIADRRQKGEPDEPEAFEQTDAALARAIELAKSEPYWLVRASIERARLRVQWKGYGPEPIQIYKDALAVLADYPDLARRVAEAAAKHARNAKDDEFLRWSLTRLTEAEPYRYDVWQELAQLTARQGEDGTAVLAGMAAKLENDAQAQITYASHLAGLGQHAEALEHLEQFLPKSHAPAATLAAIAQIHLGARDVLAAQLVLDRLRKDHPDAGPTAQVEAAVARSEGRIADEIAALEEWTRREETATGLGLLAAAYLRSGRARGALEMADRAIALKQGPRPDLQLTRGRALVRLGEHRSALQAFSRARSSGGVLPPEYLSDVAMSYYALGQRDEARRLLDRVLASPTPPGPALLLFAREEGERDPKAAREALEKGTALYGGALPFVAALANLDLREGERDAALERVRAAAAQMPDSPDGQKLLVEMLVTQGYHDEAAKQVELIAERWPAYLGVAELYLDVMTLAGRGNEAFETLSKQQASGQLSPFGRVVLARLHHARGEHEKAIELLRSALDEVPNLPSAANDLAYALAQRGEDLQEATELAQEARASRPESSEIADTLGFVYLRRNLAEAALVQFDAALELAEPGGSAWATAQFHRGLALQQLEREQEAIVALEKALASGADFAEVQDAHRVLGELARTTTPAAAKEGS
jgi:tetratricopeptide (TPR) repeat protein